MPAEDPTPVRERPRTPGRGEAIWPSPLHAYLSPAQLAVEVDRCRAEGWQDWEIDVRFGPQLPQAEQ